jgi:ATP-dependent Lon protease
VEDKLIVVNKHIIPDINKKIGFEDIVEIDEIVAKEIIENYTNEPGVRKLKEILFDLYGGINLEFIKPDSNGDNGDDPSFCDKNSLFFDERTDKRKYVEFPFRICKENFDKIREKYLNKYHKIKHVSIHDEKKIGIVNGLWANLLGNGGIIPIECVFYPCVNFLELQLTGLQGDVMKESMNVAKSLAWKLTPLKRQKELLNYFKNTKCQGLHIHCPEGSISKDGPSAGAAITLSIYSLFNNVKINNKIAITGEINLQGIINEIGGFEAKIKGGVKAGIITFFYPYENQKDVDKYLNIKPFQNGMKNKFTERNGSEEELAEIKFVPIKNIEELLSSEYVYV